MFPRIDRHAVFLPEYFTLSTFPLDTQFPTASVYNWDVYQLYSDMRFHLVVCL